MAFLIAMLVMLWFFGVTVFNFKPLALKGQSMLASVFSTQKYEARIGNHVIDSKEGVHKSDVAKLCTGVILMHPTEQVICYWGDKPVHGIGFLSQ